MKHFIVVMVVLGVASLVFAAAWARGADKVDDSSHWGVGNYMTNDAGTLFDHARWDWMVVRFTGPAEDAAATIERFNQFLAVNPNQRYLIRLTPGVSTPDHAHVNFLHYRYDPQVRKIVQQQLREQIRLTRQRLAKPENILAYTFMEELPGTFGFEALRQGSAASLPPQAAFYRKQIEAERGQPLAWDEATWRWLGQVFEETIDELHALIKQESGGAPVLFWTHIGYPSLDHAETAVDFQNGGHVAFSYKNVIKPGRCEGLVGNPLTEEVWAQYLRVAKEFDCILTCFLPHNGYMRARSWDQALAMVKQLTPQYRGYSFFCEPQGKPHPLDKPDAAATLREFRDRFVQLASFPERGYVLKVVHPRDAQRPFINQAASYLYSVEHPTHGSKGLSVTPGQTLHWSILLKTEDIQGDEGAGLVLVWDLSKGGGAQPKVLNVSGTHDWKTYQGTIVVPEDTVGARVYVGLRRATGTAYFDDLRITADESDQSLIENGSFEEIETEPLHWKGWIIDDHSLVLAHWRVFCDQQKVGNHLKPDRQ